ncbi:tetratricopeptide repeat protein [Brumimicrobium glaciale]|uniref:histidine kinase n=1 Tax=Brumimicrobium glaciale TaxID=200475 RepID=A0A4Q4KNP3_9FLAO|nr:sensor histidine kinase [Brumimicrobium glaciale]RYM34054.1 tetratricopeptide repeat protein [Brumimicrobium glaciale]
MIQKTTKYFLLSVLCLITWTSLAAANNNDKEESQAQIKKSIESNLKKIIYFDSIKNVDSLDFYLEIGERLCEKTKLSRTEKSDLHYSVGQIYSLVGSGYYRKNELAEALIFFEKAVNIFHLLDIKNELARSLNNLAIIYLKIGNQTKALKYLHRSTSIFIDTKDSIATALGYNSIAKIYRDQVDLPRTQEYLDKALYIARKLNNSDVLSSVLNSTAGLKKELGDVEGALSMYSEALSFAKNAENEMKSALILNNLGVIHKEMGELEEAKAYFERAYKISIDNNSTFGKVFTLINLADYYYLSQNYFKALEFSKQAFEISEHTANNEGKYKSVLLLIKISEEQKDWERTAFYQKILIKYNEKNEKQIIEQISNQETIRYKLEKDKIISNNKEVQAQLNSEKEMQRLNFYYIILVMIFIVLITFSLIIYSRLRSSREANKNITKQSEERKLLLQEVHHRVKNNFQIVSSMLRLQSYNFDNEILRQNFEEAVNRINAMAIVRDVIYRQEKFSDIDSKTYLEKLVKNLHRSGDSRILIAIESEEIPFKIETLINLGIALNELITNSFKHAFNDTIFQPKISISLKTIDHKTYELIYKDNGIGINQDDYKSSFGMELIETIISNFDGEVTFAPEMNWNTLIKITFTED